MIYIGSAGWNIPRVHKDRFPAAGSVLRRYGTRLNATEINTSFYRPHAAATYERWASGVPRDFRFSVKIPKVITHEHALLRTRQALERFLGEIAGLGDKLGPLLIQLPPSHTYEPRRTARFFELLRARHEGEVVCEPRHATWTSDAATRLLQKFKIARVAADPPRAAGLETPGGWPGLVYYRWHGSPRPYFSTYSMEQLAGLAVKLIRVDTRPRSARVAHSPRSFAARGAPVDVWCIFDNTGSGSAAGNALDLRAITK